MSLRAGTCPATPSPARCRATGHGPTPSRCWRCSRWTATASQAACPLRTARPAPSRPCSCSTSTTTASGVRARLQIPSNTLPNTRHQTVRPPRMHRYEIGIIVVYVIYGQPAARVRDARRLQGPARAQSRPQPPLGSADLRPTSPPVASFPLICHICVGWSAPALLQDHRLHIRPSWGHRREHC